MKAHFAIGLAFLCALVILGGPVLAQEKGNTHSGKIVSVQGNKITMVDDQGKNEHTHTLAADGKISLNGQDAKLSDLKPGMAVKVTTKDGDKNTAVRIEARQK
jgi:hypothetical protein